MFCSFPQIKAFTLFCALIMGQVKARSTLMTFRRLESLHSPCTLLKMLLQLHSPSLLPWACQKLLLFPPPFTMYINSFLPVFATFWKSYQMFHARVSSLWWELGRPRQDPTSKARLAERDTVWLYSSWSVEKVVFKITLSWTNSVSIQFEMSSGSENHTVNNRDTNLENTKTDTKNYLLQQTTAKPCL